MSKPVAGFTFKANGLSVTFTDGSSGIITNWSWDFGNSTNSTAQNPAPVVYSAVGVYKVSLAVTNIDGTDTFTFYLVVDSVPGTNMTIKEWVQYLLPTGIAYDSIGFDQLVHSWQLYLQPAAHISDELVFDESAWPSLFNLLISRCVIYDLIMKAATASMSSFIAVAEQFNQFIANVTTETVYVADYSVPIDQQYPITINLVIANGVSYGPSGALPNVGALLSYINGLGIGIFAIDGLSNLVSYGNNKLLTTFNYTNSITGHNGAFTVSNGRVVPITVAISSSGSFSTGTKGLLKSLETGPSKASWYDSSTFWSNIFKSVGGAGLSGSGNNGGLIGQIQNQICTYSGRLRVQMPNCPKIDFPGPVFKIARGRCGPRVPDQSVWPTNFDPLNPNWNQNQW